MCLQLHLDVAKPSEFVPLWDVADLINIETGAWLLWLTPLCVCRSHEVAADLIAAALFMIVIRFIKYLRVIPGWGPMLLAVVDTLRDSTVLLYLAVMMGLQLACSFAFHIAFGADNNHFSSITRSFITVFRMVCACCNFRLLP